MTALAIFRRWLDRRRTTHELAQFSERELADIGLVRSDVLRVGAFKVER
ncbi:DUF1127 domain-containing protein [Methylobacterium sp. A54F]